MTNEEKLVEYLNNLNIHTLRQVARHFGVYSPTTKVKSELVVGILDILSGRAKPVEQSNKGAPIKDHAIDFSIIQKIQSYFNPYKEIKSTENELSVHFASSESIYDGAKFSGILIHDEEYFLRSKKGDELPFPIDEQNSNDLKEGDFVVLVMDHTDSDIQFQVLSRNAQTVTSLKKRPRFEDIVSAYPDHAFSFEDASKVLRSISLFAPIGRGQRVLISANDRTDKLSLSKNLLDTLDEQGTLPIVLGVHISSEDKADFQNNDRIELYTTDFDSDDRSSVLEMEICLNRVKRLCEEGKNVALILYSMPTLSSVSLKLAKELFSCAKNGKEKGSVTVFAYTTREELNPWREIANSYWVFDGDEFDPLSSLTKKADLLQSAENKTKADAFLSELKLGNKKAFERWLNK